MEFPEIKSTDLLEETDFYKWIQAKESEGVLYSSFIEAIRVYTKFVPTPFEGREDGKFHKYVWEHYLFTTKKWYSTKKKLFNIS